MMIFGLSCSPRKLVNTEILVNKALHGVKNEGVGVELFPELASRPHAVGTIG